MGRCADAGILIFRRVFDAAITFYEDPVSQCRFLFADLYSGKVANAIREARHSSSPVDNSLLGGGVSVRSLCSHPFPVRWFSRQFRSGVLDLQSCCCCASSADGTREPRGAASSKGGEFSSTKLLVFSEGADYKGTLRVVSEGV